MNTINYNIIDTKYISKSIDHKAHLTCSKQHNILVLIVNYVTDIKNCN